MKGTLLVALPTESWGKVNLSIAVFMPEAWTKLRAIGALTDISMIILFGVATKGLMAFRSKRERLIPVWAFVISAVVQLALIL